MTASASCYFSKATFKFLTELSRNNEREWFNDNNQRYEECVRGPALAFIEDIAPELQLIAPRFLAAPKKVGGSLMRVYRDTRFGKDKTPYKTNIGIQFRHEVGKDVHAPGYYLHIAPQECFFCIGIWRPDSTALGQIRETIRDKSDKWIAARDDDDFAQRFALGGEHFDRQQVLHGDFLHETVRHFDYATRYMQFLCGALGVRFD